MQYCSDVRNVVKYIYIYIYIYVRSFYCKMTLRVTMERIESEFAISQSSVLNEIYINLL